MGPYPFFMLFAFVAYKRYFLGISFQTSTGLKMLSGLVLYPTSTSGVGVFALVNYFLFCHS